MVWDYMEIDPFRKSQAAGTVLFSGLTLLSRMLRNKLRYSIGAAGRRPRSTVPRLDI